MRCRIALALLFTVSSAQISFAQGASPQAAPSALVAMKGLHGRVSEPRRYVRIKKIRNLSGTSVEQKVWTFPTVKVGDCELLAGATLTLTSDGQFAWNAKVMTHHTHSGDTYHRGMYGLDAAKNYVMSFWDHVEHECYEHLMWNGSEHMNDDGTVYAFTRSGTYDKTLYDRMEYVGSFDCC
jgi:hypothetical protein